MEREKEKRRLFSWEITYLWTANGGGAIVIITSSLVLLDNI